jgi:hypothetical protein
MPIVAHWRSLYKGRGGLLSRRPKNVIPERRANAVSDVIILEMMAEMILFQPKPHARFMPKWWVA